MKSTDKNAAAAAAKAGKQKKQLMAVGGLAAVLAVVLFIQFGGKSPEGEAVAQAAEQPVAGAPGAPAQPAAAPAAAPTSAAMPSVTEAPSDNPVLIKPVEGQGLTRSPFTNFWNVSGKTGTHGTSDVAAPAVTLTATMPSALRPIAVIDGQLHYVGDMIGGWELTDVQARSVMLRSPTKALMSIEMPLLPGAHR